ncbi:MAG: hypothetical protein ACRDA3_15100 [Peptostreptococcaceae bacterium]
MKNSNKDERILDISSQARMTNTSIVNIERMVAETTNLNTAQEELKELSKNNKKLDK